jgi:hypothetical protein
MKSIASLLFLVFSALPAFSANWFGSGPWSSGAYYPGATDGKYQAAVSGNNIAGVIGFAIREGSPTVLTRTNQQNGGTTTNTLGTASLEAATATAQVFDETQNYFVIFVEGRTYSGLAIGTVNPIGNTVTGTLLGAQPDFGFVTNTLPFEFPEATFTTNTNITIIGSNEVVSITNLPGVTVTNVTNTVTTNIVITDIGGVTVATSIITTNTFSNVVTTDPISITNTNLFPIFLTNTNVTSVPVTVPVFAPEATTNTFDPLPLLNRGLSGGFQASLQNKKGPMTFNGSGQLSTPAQLQTVDLVTNNAGNNIAGTIQTEMINFNLNGLRTSFLTTLAPVAPSATTQR